MSKKNKPQGWTVGSLRGEPRPTLGGRPAEPRGNAAPPPALRGLGCCRSGCFGCPWAEAMRRQGGLPGAP